MAKVITLSRKFLKGHPREGQPTYFVEKVWKSFSVKALGETFFQCMDDDCKEMNKELPYKVLSDFLSSLNKYANLDNSIQPKHHTIRGGKNWKTGDKASLRVWSDKPYRSPQIIIAPDVTLTVKDVEIMKNGFVYIGQKYFSNISHKDMELIAKNDGLNRNDLQAWFSKLPFSGQILVWNNKNLPY